MAFDISMRDNGSNTFDIALSSSTPATGNSNFFVFFNEPFVLIIVITGSFFFI